MASATFHSIIIRAANQLGDVTREEAVATAVAITPGELLQWTPGAATVRAHAVAAGSVTPKMVALESQTPEDETAFSVDDPYDASDLVYFAVAKPGDEYYMWLANGENAALQALLQSDGNGELQVLGTVVAGTLAESVVGTAVVALNNATGAPARIRVRIT